MRKAETLSPLWLCFGGLLLLVLGTQDCLASSRLSGSVQDRLKIPIDGALVTIWVPGGSKHSGTTAAGRYSFTEIEQGYYLLKVEKTGMALLYGAVRLSNGIHHEFNLVLVKKPDVEPVVKAESPYDLPSQESRLSTLDARKVKQARLLKQVTPELPSTAKITGMGATVQIAGLIRIDGTVDDIIVLSAPSPDLALAALTSLGSGAFPRRTWTAKRWK